MTNIAPKYKQLEEYSAIIPYTIQQLQYSNDIELQKILQELDEIDLKELPIDYSNFNNFVFFASAEDVFLSGKNKILTFPYGGSIINQIEWKKEISSYEKYLLSELWPKYVGHCNFSGSQSSSQYIQTGIPQTSSSSSVAIEIYVKLSSVLSSSAQIHNIAMVYDRNNLSKFVNLYFDGPTNNIYFALGDGSTTGSLNYLFTDFDQWHYLYGKWDKDNNQIWFAVDSSVQSASITLTDCSFNTIHLGSYLTSFFSGSLKEFRFWTKNLSEIERQQNWERNIYATDSLSTYYRFNEGIFGSDSVDQIILDYSNNNNDGLYYNYITNFSREGIYVSGSNSTTVANIYATFREESSPLLYDNHALIQTLISKQTVAAQDYDNLNDTQLIKQIPEHYIMKDQEENINILVPFFNSLGVLLDSIKVRIDYIKYFYGRYEEYEKAPNSLITSLLKLFGWDQQQIFTNFDILQYILPYQNNFEYCSYYSIKHKILYYLYSELVRLYKTKGTIFGIHYFLNIFSTPSFAYNITTTHNKKKSYYENKKYILLPDLHERLLFQSGSEVSYSLSDPISITNNFSLYCDYFPSSSVSSNEQFELCGLYDSLLNTNLMRIELRQEGTNLEYGRAFLYFEDNSVILSSSVLPLFDHTNGNWCLIASKEDNNISLDLYNPLWDDFRYQYHVSSSASPTSSFQGNFLSAGKTQFALYGAPSLYISYTFLDYNVPNTDRKEKIALRSFNSDMVEPKTYGWAINKSLIADNAGNIIIDYNNDISGSNFIPEKNNCESFYETTLYPTINIDYYRLDNKTYKFSVDEFLNRIKESNSSMLQVEFNMTTGFLDLISKLYDTSTLSILLASKFFNLDYNSNYCYLIDNLFSIIGNTSNRKATNYDYYDIENYIDMLKYLDINAASIVKKITAAKSNINNTVLTIENPYFVRNSLNEKYTKIIDASTASGVKITECNSIKIIDTSETLFGVI